MVSTRWVSRYDAVASVISMQMMFWLERRVVRRRASRLETGKKCVHTTTTRTDGKINKQKETHPLARAWDEFGVVDAMALNAKFDFGLVWFGFNKPTPTSHSLIPFRRHPHPERTRSPPQASRTTYPHPRNHLSRRDARDPRLTAR